MWRLWIALLFVTYTQLMNYIAVACSSRNYSRARTSVQNWTINRKLNVSTICIQHTLQVNFYKLKMLKMKLLCFKSLLIPFFSLMLNELSLLLGLGSSKLFQIRHVRNPLVQKLSARGRYRTFFSLYFFKPLSSWRTEPILSQ
jgi:hypothetical protein